MQPPPPLPGDSPGARRHNRLGLLGVLVLVIGVAVLAGIAVTAWLLVSPKLTHGGDGGDGGRGGSAKAAGPMEIRPVTSTKPGRCPSGDPGVNGVEGSGGGATCYRLGRGMTVAKVAEARAQPPSNGSGWQIAVSLNTADAQRFAELSRRYSNHRLALVTGGKVVSAPTMQGPITGGRFLIAGNFTGDEAKGIARSLGG